MFEMWQGVSELGSRESDVSNVSTRTGSRVWEMVRCVVLVEGENGWVVEADEVEVNGRPLVRDEVMVVAPGSTVNVEWDID